MNLNNARQNTALIAWDGSASTFRKITDYRFFSFVLEVTDDLAADAIFKFRTAPASAADACVHNGSAITYVKQVPICDVGDAGDDSTFTIPSGTVAGTVCTVTLPSVPGEFIELKHVSGGADVIGLLVKSGRMV